MPKSKLKKRGKARADARKNARKEPLSHATAAGRRALDAGEITGGIFAFKVHGDEVAGEVLAVEKRKGKWGEQYYVTLRTETGTKSFYCPTLLARFIEDRNVAVGDILGARYIMDVPSGKGAPAKSFRVFHTPKKPKK